MPGALRTRKMSDPLVPVVTEGCEHHKGTGELNLDLLEEQPVLITTEPSLQPGDPPFSVEGGAPLQGPRLPEHG